MDASPPRVSLTRFPRITALLCLAQVLGYLALAHGARSLPLDVLVQWGAKVSANVLELGETWRLIAANLLHRDVLHLGFNTFFLFNVGGAVENAFRGRDYSLILIGAALGTTSLSLAMSTVPSVGSSGVVLGLFGSASVVGYKYGDLLPKPYRRYFGGAVLPFALFILYVGFASPDTDNWAHLGGLAAGALVTLPLVPRFAPGPQPEWPLPAAVGLVTCVLAAGPALASSGPPLEAFRVRSSGLRLARPVRWEAGENHLGDLAWGNRLGVTLGFTAGRGEDPVQLERLKSGFIEELRAREGEGVLTRVRVVGEKPLIIPGARALELTVELESRAGPQTTRNLLIERGYFWYRVVLCAPSAWAEPYDAIFDALISEVALEDPAELEEALRMARTFPGMSSVHVERGHQLAAVGRVDEAAAAYQRALYGVPDLPEAIYGLARLTLAFGGALEAAERAVAELHASRPLSSSVVALLADLRTRLGRRDEACHVLGEALEALPRSSTLLRDRSHRLRCAGSSWRQF